MCKYYYDEYFGGKQEVLNIFYERIPLPDDDPIHMLKEIMGGLDFSQLLKQYSVKGRKATNPIMIFAVLTYGNMRGIRSVPEIVKACERDICFMELCGNNPPQEDAIYRFKNNRITTDIIDDLYYQFIKKLKGKKYVNLDKIFVDGTKIEANANRYTFVWRGSVNYHLSNLIKNINELYESYNCFIKEYKYDLSYDFEYINLLVIDGMDKVRDVIEKNRERKKNKKSKLSNNAILRINNMDINTLSTIIKNLYVISKNEGISLLSGKGIKKTELQKLYGTAKRYVLRLEKYQENFEIMSNTRNSYSKTDTDATFMRMKDDHMLNGQLKPGYNVQFGTENHFIIDVLITNDRTDYNTLIPLVEKHKNMTGVKLKELIADSGYCSEKGLKYLDDNGIKAFIKLQEHEQMKTRKYKNNIGKHYNMKKIDENTYKCENNKLLKYVYTSKSNICGFPQEYKIFESESCFECNLKEKCFYKYNKERDVQRNKQLRINERWENLKKLSNENIQSEKGILYRKIRSIQSEGAFGHMKENDNFKRFNNRGYEKVYKELLFYSFGYNLNKLYRYEQKKLKPLEKTLVA